MDIKNLQKQRVAILGLGVEGKALVDFFAAHEIQPLILDKKTESELASLRNAYKDKVREWVLGDAYAEFLRKLEANALAEKPDIIFRTPGFPRKHEALLAAERQGIKISSETQLFFELSPTRNIIGITGTKGKGTTALLLESALRTAGKKTFLAGNIGTPRLAFLHQLTPKDWVVLELSSFQLEDFPYSPRIAVVLGIMLDHLDYHKKKEHYIAAKRSLVRHQRSGDVAILDFDNPVSRSFAEDTKADVVFFSFHESSSSSAFVRDNAVILRREGKEDILLPVQDILLRGRHNVKSVCAAALAAVAAGVSLDAIREGIKSFLGQEHRLAFAGVVEGVQFYDDSSSTLPESTVAALEAFTEPLVLICGGQEKGIPFDVLAEGIVRNSGHIRKILLTGTAAPKIRKALQSHEIRDGAYEMLPEGVSMNEIVRTAAGYAQKGDIVLLSPAATSYDMFVNYAERGKAFQAALRELAKNSPFLHAQN